MPSNHMALNQGVEDQLLFDNSKSYFVDPGYERTSNFQMELVDVEPMNSAAPGQTIQFMLPQSGDLIGDLDLSFAFNTPTSVEPAANATNCISAWVESVGYAMIDYAEFTVGSTVLQRITGDQMYLMNELKQKKKRQSSQVGTTGMSAMHRFYQTIGGVTDNAGGGDDVDDGGGDTGGGGTTSGGGDTGGGGSNPDGGGADAAVSPGHFRMIFRMEAAYVGDHDLNLQGLTDISVKLKKLLVDGSGRTTGIGWLANVSTSDEIRFFAGSPSSMYFEPYVNTTRFTQDEIDSMMSLLRADAPDDLAGLALDFTVERPADEWTGTTEEVVSNPSLRSRSATAYKTETGVEDTEYGLQPWSNNASSTTLTHDGYPGDGPWSRVLHDVNQNAATLRKQKKEYHVPLSFFFTESPGKYFPMAALHGVNDIRVTLRLRSLEELLLIAPNWSFSGVAKPLAVPKFAGGVFKHFRLRAHYYALSGPEATALASKEQVRLIEEWQHLRSPKTFKCTALGRAHKVDIDLNFLHPVKELIFVLRRSSEMTPDVSTSNTYGHATQGPATKNYFAFHGDPAEGDPNIDGLQNAYPGKLDSYQIHLDVDKIKLKLNGSERHTMIDDGVGRDYLSDMIVGRQRSTFANNDSNNHIGSMLMASSKNGYDGTMKDRAAAQLQKMHDSKSIFVYPLCIDAEGDNPSGSVNFSKVSHAKLSFDVTAFSGGLGPDVDTEFYIDVYAVSYNWLQIRDGRALVSFA
jgi:hypothetical protein